MTAPRAAVDQLTSLRILAFGLHIAISATDRSLLDDLRPRLPFGWKHTASTRVERSLTVMPARTVGPRFSIAVDGAPPFGTFTREQVLGLLALDIQMYVAEHAPRRVFVHAGAVGWGGRAIVLPGRSHAGKSTLTAALIRAGARYYSDEYAVLDAHGRVHPYHKPLAMREGPDSQQTDRPVEYFGGHLGRTPLPVGLIVVSTYEPGATWKPIGLSAGMAALELLANTVSARRNPERAFAAFGQIMSTAVAFKGLRGEAGDVVTFILDILQRNV